MRAAPAKRTVATLERWVTAEPSQDGPLQFDFEKHQTPQSPRQEKAASIKEALLRWLDQQL